MFVEKIDTNEMKNSFAKNGFVVGKFGKEVEINKCGEKIVAEWGDDDDELYGWPRTVTYTDFECDDKSSVRKLAYFNFMFNTFGDEYKNAYIKHSVEKAKINAKNEINKMETLIDNSLGKKDLLGKGR